jgi:hypothetical protein
LGGKAAPSNSQFRNFLGRKACKQRFDSLGSEDSLLFDTYFANLGAYLFKLRIAAVQKLSFDKTGKAAYIHIVGSEKTMVKFEHPFAKVCRAVLKEKRPDKEAAIPDGSPLAAADIPEDVIDEALKRYYAGKKLIISPRIQALPTQNASKQEIKRTITYV